jgi:poly(3-hydroxybutyrate) depolymerase
MKLSCNNTRTMNRESRYRIVALLVILVMSVAFAGRSVPGVADCDGTPQVEYRMAGKLVDHPTYMMYLPDGWQPEKSYPLVFALSPGADALSMISAWAAVADKHQWLVAASKEYRNGVSFDILLGQIEAELDSVERNYLIDNNRVVFTGMSGGGMGAHAVSWFFPNRVDAIVINTGMMNFMTEDYPEGKLAVFLASPMDFRYSEMQRDRDFLERHRWKTKWIEFRGGHTMAPAVAYEEAAEWLEEHLPNS